jgi:hypothetical protein
MKRFETENEAGQYYNDNMLKYYPEYAVLNVIV